MNLIAKSGFARTVHSMGKGTPRRKRGAYTHQPTISSDLLTCVRASYLLAEILSCCKEVSARRVLDEIIQPSLRLDQNASLVDHLSQTGAKWVTANANVFVLGVSLGEGWDPCEEGCSVVYTPDMYSELVNALHANLLETHKSEAAQVDPLVEAISLEGFDGESLASEVIVRETAAHTGLLHKEISKLRNTIPDTESGELLGFAWRGLRVALRQFDPTRGFAFSTYACPRINGAIRDGVRSESHLPKRLTTVARKISLANESLTQKLNTSPSMNQICEYLDIPNNALVTRLSAPASLDELSSMSESASIPTNLVDNQDPAEAAMLLLRSEAVTDALQTLGETERAVLVGVYFQDLTLTAVAKELNIDVRLARSMRDAGLTHLRAGLSTWV